MANLIIEAPDDLTRNLEGIAAAQHKSIQQLAIERSDLARRTQPGPYRGLPRRGVAGNAGTTSRECFGC
jgi:hypothetical protein